MTRDERREGEARRREKTRVRAKGEAREESGEQEREGAEVRTTDVKEAKESPHLRHAIVRKRTQCERTCAWRIRLWKECNGGK